MLITWDSIKLQSYFKRVLRLVACKPRQLLDCEQAFLSLPSPTLPLSGSLLRLSLFIGRLAEIQANGDLGDVFDLHYLKT